MGLYNVHNNAQKNLAAAFPATNKAVSSLKAVNMARRAGVFRSVTQDEVREILMDSDSDEDVISGSESEEPVSPHEGNSVVRESDSENESESDVDDSEWRDRLPGDKANVHVFTGPPHGLSRLGNEHFNSDTTPLENFKLIFTDELFGILLGETNRYALQTLGADHKQPEIKMHELYRFLAIIVQMGHCQRDTLKDYWSTQEQYYTPFYSKTMKRDRFLHILRVLHFENNDNAPDKTDPSYDRLWKVRKVFSYLNDKFSSIYNPTEHLAVDEVIVLFKGRVIFKQYIPKKHKRFGIKMYKLCDRNGYTYDMTVYLGKQRQNAAANINSTHGTVLQLTRKVEGVGHKLFIDNYFSSPALFNDLHGRKVNSCGTVRHNRKDMAKNFGPKDLKLKKGDIISKVKENLCAISWKDKREVYLLTNMHNPPPSGHFIDDNGIAPKPVIIESYNAHMGYCDKSDRMANSYDNSRRTWKWTKKLFFHLLNIVILNAFIIHTSCEGKLSQKEFRELLVRNLIQAAQDMNPELPATNLGRPVTSVARLSRLEVKSSKHWPNKGSSRRCKVCSDKGKASRSNFHCEECDVALCVYPCFKMYHTKSTF